MIITPVVYSGFLSQKTGFKFLVPPSGEKPLAGCGLSTAIVELPVFNSKQDTHVEDNKKGLMICELQPLF